MSNLLDRCLRFSPVCLILVAAVSAMAEAPHRSSPASVSPDSAPSAATPIVRGTVRTAAGEPLPEARVELHAVLSAFAEGSRLLSTGRPDGPPAATVRTDADGRFEVRAPAPGMWRLVVDADGFVPVQNAPLPLVENRELPPVSLLADVGTNIEILGPEEAPIVNAWVIAATSGDSPVPPLSQNDLRHGWSPAPRIGRSSDIGHLKLPRSDKEWLDFTVVFPWSAVPQQIFAVEGMRLLIEPGRPLRRRFTIRGPDGAPVPDVLVSLGQAGWPVGFTNTDGQLDIPGRFNRKLPIQLLSADGRRRVAWLGPGTDSVKAVLPARVEVTGKVVDVRQQAIANALVWQGNDSGRVVWTDDDGRYHLGASRSERFWIQAEASAFLPRRDKVEPLASSSDAAATDSMRPGPTLSLIAAAALGGQVVDPRGEPITDADVIAAVTDSEQRVPAFRSDRAADRTRSRTDGGFQLDRLQAGIRHDLTVAKEGFGTRTVTVEWPQTTPSAADEAAVQIPAAPLQIVLVPSRSVYAFGRVIDLDEQPITNASVQLRPASKARAQVHARVMEEAIEDEDPFTGLTDGDGSFEIKALPASRVDLTASAPGFVAIRVPGIALPAGRAEIDLGTLVLEPGVPLSGRVVDPDGTGLAGIAVWRATELGNSPSSALARLGGAPPEVETAGDGSFELPDLASGSQHHLLFHGEGYLTDWRRDVTAPLAEPILVVLRPGGAIRGRVIDVQERPIAASRISIQPADLTAGTLDVQQTHSEHGQTVLSDEDGTFVIDTIAPGPYEAEAFAPAYQPAEPISLTVEAGVTIADLEFVLLRGATLEGRVMTSDDEPVTSARVMVGRPAGVTDSEGYYRIEGIPPGPQMVEVRHPIFNRERQDINIEEGINTLDVVLESGYSLTGRVIDEHDQPVSQVQLTLTGGREYHDDSTSTGADGTFNFPQVAVGTYRLRATKEGYAATDRPAAIEIIDAPVEDFEIRLLPGSAIVGQISGIEIDELAELEITARSRTASGGRGHVDYEGRYQIRDLGVGEWQVRARLPGGRREVDGWVQVPPQTREVTLDLEFGSGVTLSGAVLHNGEPLAGARVAAFGHSVNARRQVVTDYQGYFSIEDLPHGKYRIDTSHSRELLVHNLDLDLASDLDITIEIDTAEVSGRVTSTTDAAPIANAVVAVQQILGPEAIRDGGMFTVGTDAEGRFRLARITQGTYRLTVRRDGYEPLEQTLELGGGAETLELDLTPTDGLELVLQMATGQHPPHATVNVFDEAGRILVAESRPVDAAGQVRFPTVPPGQWSLLVVAPGSAPVQAVATIPGEPLSLVLPEGKSLTVRVPALIGSRQAASVSLLGTTGHPFVGIGSTADGAQTMWRLVGGAAVVEGVPAGLWIVQVAAADGQIWSAATDVGSLHGAEITLE